MSGQAQTDAQINRAGISRACAEFTQRLVPLGFVRVKTRRTWLRHVPGFTDFIQLDRHPGSSVHSIDFRMLVASHPGRLKEASSYNGPWCEHLRDARGYTYHLRFNARTWSAYERCMDDLMRMLDDHLLPWFEQHHTQPSPST